MTSITSNGTGGGNWSATASWTGAVVPIEGDTVIIQNGDTITIDQTITVGADTATAAIDIASGGKLEVLSTVVADYTLTSKGDLKISSGGTLEIGTSSNPIPAARTFTIQLNYSASLAEGKYGLLNHGEMVMQGASKTVKTLLTADLSATGTVLTIGDTTNWEVSDRLAIASTSRTWSEAEDETISTVDSATQVTLSAGVTYAHSGTSPTQAEVINLTRNVKVTSYNTSYRGYVQCLTNSTSDIDYVEFYMIGCSGTDKYGIVIRTSVLGATNFDFCSVWGLATINYSFLLYFNYSNVNNTVIYNTAKNFYISGSYHTITNNTIIKSNEHGFYIVSKLNTINNNIATSCKSYGFRSTHSGEMASFDSNTAHSNNSYGVSLTSTEKGIFYSITSWRNNAIGVYLKDATIDINTLTLFGNKDSNIAVGACNVSIKNLIANGDSTFATSYGIILWGGTLGCKLIDCVFGEVSGIKVAHSGSDVQFNSNYLARGTCVDCKFFSSINVNNIENAYKGSYLECENYNQVQYADKAWYKYGIVVRDSTTKKTGSYSMRFDYLWVADDWLEYELEIPVKDGESVVVSAWLRKNASYTSANRPKIKLSGTGITEVEDQMSDVTNTWEKVSVSGTPTRTGMAKLTIMTYLTNAGASAWCDFEKTGLTMPVLNTLEGDFWVNGHMATILFDTGSITAAEFWKTLTTGIDKTGSFGNLFKDHVDAAISGRAPANEYDTEMGYIPSDLIDVPTLAELNVSHGSGSWEGTTPSDVANAVWDKPVAEHTIAGTFGRLISKKLLTVAKFIGLK